MSLISMSAKMLHITRLKLDKLDKLDELDELEAQESLIALAAWLPYDAALGM